MSLGLDRGVKRQMNEAGVGFSRLGPAMVRGRVATMPIDGGQMEGPPAKGVAIPLGGIRFGSGRKIVRLSKIGLDITHGELGARIEGEQRVVATFRGVAVVRDGFSAELTMRNLRLTDGAATILNRELEQPGLFRGGRRLASMSLDLELRTIKAHTGQISLSLDEAFRAKLESREVAVSPFELAAAASAIAPALDFPISYGRSLPAFRREVWARPAGCASPWETVQFSSGTCSSFRSSSISTPRP